MKFVPKYMFPMLLCGLLDIIRHTRCESQHPRRPPMYGPLPQCVRVSLSDKQNTAKVTACYFQDWVIEDCNFHVGLSLSLSQGKPGTMP